MNTIELLEAGRAVIATPETWTQCASARDDYGRRTYARDPAAVCWCSTGALISTLDGETNGSVLGNAEDALNNAALRLSGGRYEHVALFNDCEPHARVLAMFDDAIAAEKAKVFA